MAYVPPHMRKGNAAQTPAPDMLAPSFRNNTKFRSRGSKPSADRIGKAVYGDNAIKEWFAVGLYGKDMPPISLQQVPVELVKRITGKSPLSLVNNGLLNDGQPNRDSLEKPWAYIMGKILRGLLLTAESVRSTMQQEGMDSREIKLKLVARVGEVLLLPRMPSTLEEHLYKDTVCEASLRQLKTCFYTNVPAPYMESIVDEVVPKIGVEFKDLKDVYHVKLSDQSRPESIIICKCRVMKEENKLQLYKIKLNEIRNMVYDISCIEKNLDLRLMLSTKRTLTSLSNDEMESIRYLIASAVLDPSLSGGLRWPFGKATACGDRFRVTGTWHVVLRVYESPLLRLEVRDADRYDFRTSFGEVTGEVTLKLKGVASKLQGKNPESSSVSDVLEDTLKLLWEHFLPHSNV